ncbi:MAG: Spy/CpxP family protein refolding chaperone [Piscinibacter sp.]|uniref:Spy/CpxP family protein refolding chaperone n=1 Tax=Piscinibacter TaxID=1114981 RepID=UPI000FDDB504|nr:MULTISPECIES: Spy/CpxP family protein refolding chaperone [Piscinibacter]MCW5666634.1 Spy/CpxP family protein refolding chaperone [Piscinibacter sp.]
MDQIKTTPAARASRAHGLKWMLLSAALAVSATVALSAWAGPMHGGPMGGGYGGPFGGHGMMAGRGVDHMLDGLNATDAQRSQIKQIMQAAAADLRAQRQNGQALREKAMQVFAAPNVDAAAAESVRQQMLAQHDQASKRMLQAMLDASQVLTPEQRAKLGERMKQRADIMRERQQRMEREQPAR